MSETRQSTSILESQVKDTTKDTVFLQQQNPGAFMVLQPSSALIVPITVDIGSIPRSAVGVVNDAGDVLDDNGNIVGKTADADSLKNLVDNIVNSAGDVVSSTSDVLGEALPVGQDKQGDEKQEEQSEEHDSHDEERSEYTTQPVKKKSGGLSLCSLKGKPLSAETPQTPKQAEEAKDEMPEVSTEDQGSTGISFKGHDVPTDNKEAAETQDKLKVSPEEAMGETSKAEDVAKGVQPGGQKPEVLTKKQPEDVTSKVDERVDEQDVPSVPEAALQHEAPKSEIPECEIPKSEAPKSKAPGKEAAGELAEQAKKAAAEAEEDAKEPLDFSILKGTTVDKEGNLVNEEGNLIGRAIKGEVKKLIGMKCDDQGTIWGDFGKVLGKAEPLPEWERGEPKDYSILKGCNVDEDGDILDRRGTSSRERAEQEEAMRKEVVGKDKKLASALAYNINQTQDKIRPICKMINDDISACEAQLKKERDEDELVRQVRPLIEEGGKILAETNDVIRGLDPDGRIQRNAKQKAAIAEGTPEEYHLAELLKEARRKFEGMPLAKKELNPLWALLAAPLFQIIAGVGLLLNGMLGLVGKLVGPLVCPFCVVHRLTS
ncbi:hypothetical protein ACJZ2D_016488 [Fusarium nematophilum]